MVEFPDEVHLFSIKSCFNVRLECQVNSAIKAEFKKNCMQKILILREKKLDLNP